jgi:stage II sporulation protein R
MVRALVCLLIVLLCVPDVAAAGRQQSIIRLHVLAHDDSAAEQAAKLAVRDVLLAETVALIGNAASACAAEALITANLPRLKTLAEAELSRVGSLHGASLIWGRFLFPARTYRQIVLPAGVYPALYVNIGSGRGSNWWCIMYPPLCYVPGVVRRGERPRHESALLNMLRGLWRRINTN